HNKKYINISFLLFTIIGAAIWPGNKNENVNLTGKTVGMTNREYKDSSRNNWLGTGPRPMRVIIWYPGDSSSSNEFSGDSSKGMFIWKNANLASADSRYPLLLISPGSGQNASNMLWLGHYLSSHGYITAAVSHNGTPEKERQNGTY